MTNNGDHPDRTDCPECGYSLAGLGACPECGWLPGTPVSTRRMTASLLFYYACYIPIVEAVVLAGWGVLRLLAPRGSASVILTAVSSSVLGVIASMIITSVAKYSDLVFARLRWVCLVIAIAVAIGLGALAVVRSGNHAVLLYALTLLNAGVAYVALVSKGVPVSLIGKMHSTPGSDDADP